MNIKKLIRRILAVPTFGQVMYGGCPGPCPPPIVTGPFEKTLSAGDVAAGGRKDVCHQLCSNAGKTCADGLAGAVYEGPPLAPTSVPCVPKKDRFLDASRLNADDDAGAASEAIEQVPVPSNISSPGWSALRGLAAVTSKPGPHSEQDCFAVCARADQERRGGVPVCSETPAGSLLIQCKFPGSTENLCSQGGAGRAPTGLVPLQAERDLDALSRYWLELQHLEAASVVAFHELADELSNLGAPVDLVRRAQRAADEETMHAALVEAELAKHGVRAATVQRQETQARDLLTLARDNARDGCVAEAFGAVLAGHQARFAATASLRALFAKIAVDESDHAELAWDIHAWAMQSLAPAEADDVRQALRSAAAALADQETQRATRVPETTLADVGLDDFVRRAQLAREFSRAVWAEA